MIMYCFLYNCLSFSIHRKRLVLLRLGFYSINTTISSVSIRRIIKLPALPPISAIAGPVTVSEVAIILCTTERAESEEGEVDLLSLAYDARCSY